jgi:RecB family endonuclease NucS
VTTLAEAIEQYVRNASGAVSADSIRRDVNALFPGQWKPATYAGHLYGCVVNNPKAYLHHPSFKRFLYHRADGAYELYDESLHGPNEWVPSEAEDVELAEAQVEAYESSIGLERDLEDHLVHHLDGIESGLTLLDRQISVAIGRIDILARDRSGATVVIEVKVGEAKDAVVGQVARYMGWFSRTEEKAARGVVVAASFPDGVKYAATAIPNLRLVSYKVSFAFNEATL